MLSTRNLLSEIFFEVSSVCREIATFGSVFFKSTTPPLLLMMMIMTMHNCMSQVVEKIDPLTNTTKLQRQMTWFGELSSYSIGYKYANQTLFTFLPLLLLLVFNSLLVRQVSQSLSSV